MASFRKKPKNVPARFSEPKEKKLRKFKSLAAISSVFRRGQTEASSAHDTNPIPVIDQQVAVLASEQVVASKLSISSQHHAEDFQSRHEPPEQQHVASQQASDTVPEYQDEAAQHLASQHHQDEDPQYQDEAAQHLASQHHQGEDPQYQDDATQHLASQHHQDENPQNQDDAAQHLAFQHHQDENPQCQDGAVQHDTESSEFYGQASKTDGEAPEHHEEASKPDEEIFELNEADSKLEEKAIPEVLQAQTKPRKIAKRERIQPTYFEVPLPVRALTTEMEILEEELGHIKEKKAKKPYLRNDDASSQENLLEDSTEEGLNPITEERKAKKYKRPYLEDDNASSQEELLEESSDSPAREIDPKACLPLPLLAGSLSMRSVDNSEKVRS